MTFIVGSILSAVLPSIVREVLNRDDVPVKAQDVSTVTTRVVSAIEANPTVAVVPVKSSFASKINWTAFVMGILTLGTAFGLPIDDGLKVKLVAVIVPLGSALIVVIKTFYTRSISKASKG